MSADLTQLIPDFHVQVLKLVDRCAEEGIKIVPYVTLRTPWEQAILWRRSRNSHEISNKLQYLENNSAKFLYFCIKSVGTVPTAPWATNAISGLSFHQWGEAVDCYVLGADGNIDWNGASESYRTYAEIAENELGLEAGFFWPKRDSVHVQYRAGRILDLYNIQEVDKAMRERFLRGDEIDGQD